MKSINIFLAAILILGINLSTFPSFSQSFTTADATATISAPQEGNLAEQAISSAVDESSSSEDLALGKKKVPRWLYKRWWFPPTLKA